MLVTDVVRRVRQAAGDEAVLQFTNETLTDWINDGIRECVVENLLLQATATTITEASKSSYTLPADIFKMHSIIIDEKKIELLTLDEWQDKELYKSRAGTPEYACIYAGSINLYPVPEDEKDFLINYTKTPVEIAYDSETDVWNPQTLGIPEAFHPRLVIYCLAQVAYQDDDYPKYQALMADFQSGVVDLKHAKDETENLYPFIHYVERD